MRGKGTTPPVLTLTAPTSGWTVEQMIEVSGKVSDTTIDPLVVSINGDRYLIRNFGGSFRRKFPMMPGKNSVVVQASNQAGTTQLGKTVHAEIPQAPLFMVLTSDTDGIYTDLHVYEPLPQSKDPFLESKTANNHVYWAMTESPSGGRFYLNHQGGDFDEPGYGPYLYTHRSPPLGIYRIDANYWPSGDKAHAVATLNMTLFGGTPKEVRRTVKAPLIMPGETLTLAWIKLERDQKASIYIPSLDPKPGSTKIWPQWVLDEKMRKEQQENPI
jgi:uncharacterized protein YfaP (DUF2135 family)